MAIRNDKGAILLAPLFDLSPIIMVCLPIVNPPLNILIRRGFANIPQIIIATQQQTGERQHSKAEK